MNFIFYYLLAWDSNGKEEVKSGKIILNKNIIWIPIYPANIILFNKKLCFWKGDILKCYLLGNLETKRKWNLVKSCFLKDEWSWILFCIYLLVCYSKFNGRGWDWEGTNNLKFKIYFKCQLILQIYIFKW